MQSSLKTQFCSVLGKGATGAVFQGVNKHNGETVAVIVMIIVVVAVVVVVIIVVVVIVVVVVAVDPIYRRILTS